MRILMLLLLSIVLAIPPVTAALYRWVDEQGNVVLSDRPPPPGVQGHEIEALEPLNIVSPPPESSRTEYPEQIRGEETAPYDRIYFVSPQDDEAVRANDGNVTIVVGVEPGLSLHPGHVIVLSLDGREVARGDDTEIRLENLDRGTHELQAEIRNRSDKVLETSSPIRFHVLRHFRRPPS